MDATSFIFNVRPQGTDGTQASSVGHALSSNDIDAQAWLQALDSQTTKLVSAPKATLGDLLATDTNIENHHDLLASVTRIDASQKTLFVSNTAPFQSTTLQTIDTLDGNSSSIDDVAINIAGRTHINQQSQNPLFEPEVTLTQAQNVVTPEFSIQTDIELGSVIELDSDQTRNHLVAEVSDLIRPASAENSSQDRPPASRDISQLLRLSQGDVDLRPAPDERRVGFVEIENRLVDSAAVFNARTYETAPTQIANLNVVFTPTLQTLNTDTSDDTPELMTSHVAIQSNILPDDPAVNLVAELFNSNLNQIENITDVKNDLTSNDQLIIVASALPEASTDMNERAKTNSDLVPLPTYLTETKTPETKAASLVYSEPSVPMLEPLTFTDTKPVDKSSVVNLPNASQSQSLETPLTWSSVKAWTDTKHTPIQTEPATSASHILTAADSQATPAKTQNLDSINAPSNNQIEQELLFGAKSAGATETDFKSHSTDEKVLPTQHTRTTADAAVPKSELASSVNSKAPDHVSHNSHAKVADDKAVQRQDAKALADATVVKTDTVPAATAKPIEQNFLNANTSADSPRRAEPGQAILTDLQRIAVDTHIDKIDQKIKIQPMAHGLATNNIITESPLMLTTNAGEFQGQVALTAPIMGTGTELTGMTQVSPAQTVTPALPPAALQSVADTLIRASASNGRLSLQLDPPEMGRVYIEFQFDTERGVIATIRSDVAETMTALREKSDFFQQILKDSGFENVDLNFESGSGTEHTNMAFEQSFMESDETLADEPTVHALASHQTAQNIYHRALETGVDLIL